MRPDILTQSGKYFNLEAPNMSDICIEDIAHGLSNICRFNGQCSQFYSVAQHSVLVSFYVPDAFAMQALLHDAAEAYVGDVVSPLKALLPNFKKIENRIQKAIYRHFNVDVDMSMTVKRADLKMLCTEQRDLMPPHDDVWSIIEGIDPSLVKIKPLLPEKAKALFMDRFNFIDEHRNANPT